MKTRMAVITLIPLIWFAGSATAKSQDKNTPAEPRVLIIGVAEKIDTKGKSITLTHAISLVVEAPTTGAGGASGGGRGGRGGRGRGGGSNGGGGGGSGGGGGGVRTATAPVSGQVRTEYKVVVSPSTVLKEGETEIHWMDLKVGDQLEVTTKKESAKVDAIEIIRVPKDNSKAP